MFEHRAPWPRQAPLPSEQRWESQVAFPQHCEVLVQYDPRPLQPKVSMHTPPLQVALPQQSPLDRHGVPFAWHPPLEQTPLALHSMEPQQSLDWPQT